MPLGQGIGELWEAVRERIELSGEGPTWQVTAGSFDAALAYARERFDDPVVLSRSDRDRWWPRVTLTVTTDRDLAAQAPPLEELARPPVPQQATAPVEAADRREHDDLLEEAAPPRRRREATEDGGMPASLAAIFDHQEELRLARQRVPDHDRR